VEQRLEAVEVALRGAEELKVHHDLLVVLAAAGIAVAALLAALGDVGVGVAA